VEAGKNSFLVFLGGKVGNNLFVMGFHGGHTSLRRVKYAATASLKKMFFCGAVESRQHRSTDV